MFGTRSPLPSITAGDAKAGKPSPRKTGANESDSEITESESEWEKEKARKKAQRDEELEKASLTLPNDTLLLGNCCVILHFE